MQYIGENNLEDSSFFIKSIDVRACLILAGAKYVHVCIKAAISTLVPRKMAPSKTPSKMYTSHGQLCIRAEHIYMYVLVYM